MRSKDCKKCIQFPKNFKKNRKQVKKKRLRQIPVEKAIVEKKFNDIVIEL